MLCLPSAADNFFVIVPLFLAGAAASSGFFATGSLPVSFCFFCMADSSTFEFGPLSRYSIAGSVPKLGAF
jgi:hypothetical protein